MMNQCLDDWGLFYSWMAYVANDLDRSILNKRMMVIDDDYAWIWQDKVLIKRVAKRSDFYIIFMGNDYLGCCTCEKYHF